MSEKPPSKDEALEALDFIVNVLKEHEKDLDRLISELGTVAGQLGETGELNQKVAKIEDKISSLQDEIGSFIKHLSTQTQQPQAATAKLAAAPAKETKTETAETGIVNATPVIVRCKQWEDFQAFAIQAQTVSFAYNETERTFEANALKDNQVIIYSGELPKFASLLKMWLATQLEVSERKILEGMLALG